MSSLRTTHLPARLAPALVLVCLAACGDDTPTCEAVVEQLCKDAAACTSDTTVRISVDQVGTATYSDADFCFSQIGSRVCTAPALAEKVRQCAGVYSGATCDTSAKTLQVESTCGAHLLGGS